MDDPDADPEEAETVLDVESTEEDEVGGEDRVVFMNGGRVAKLEVKELDVTTLLLVVATMEDVVGALSELEELVTSAEELVEPDVTPDEVEVATEVISVAALLVVSTVSVLDVDELADWVTALEELVDCVLEGSKLDDDVVSTDKLLDEVV